MNLTIEATISKNLGRCYHSQEYLCSSTQFVSKEQLEGLFKLGFFGAGQEFRILNRVAKKDDFHQVYVERRTDSGD